MSVKLKIREIKPSSSSASSSTTSGCNPNLDGLGSACSDGSSSSGLTSRTNNLGVRAGRFGHLKLILLFLFKLVVKFWSICTTALFIIFLIFWFYGGLITLLLVIIASLGLLYHGQDMLIYYPQQPRNARIYVDMPSLLKLPFESSYLQTKDGTSIHVVLIKQPSYSSVTAPTVIFFHGNAGNIGHRYIIIFINSLQYYTCI
ncbi:protein ABHD13 [Octopus sinensis]|uniref:Protein ABHD13 n=1 Tax=Octopus sinensis TaxID=2607531 RepID=A0A6P7S9T1_9MOLL|nr:protein ABHD13 [Octopus sinensis]